MNKTGQFYLIAAMVIITVVYGLVTIFNQAKTPPKETIIYELAQEMSYESGYTIDAGVFQEKEDGLIHINLENLSDGYSVLNPTSDILVVFGNTTSLIFLLYDSREAGQVGVSFGGSSVNFPLISSRKLKKVSLRDSESILVILEDGTKYNVVFREGNIYFTIIKKERGGERFVALSNSQ